MADRMQTVTQLPDEKIRFHAGAANDSELVLIGGLDVMPRFEPYNRIFSFKADRDELWKFVEIDEDYIPAITQGRLKPEGPDYFFVVSQEGNFWGLSQPGHTFSERIPGAGYNYDDSIYGDISNIALVKNNVYVCGNKQVHKRDDKRWENISGSLSDSQYFLVDICGHDHNELYAIAFVPPSAESLISGEVPDYRDKEYFVLHFDGESWNVIDKLDFTLSCIIVDDETDDVLIGGQHGVILRGNVKTGFNQITTRVPDPASLNNIDSICKYQGQIYVNRGNPISVLRDGDIQNMSIPLSPPHLGALWLFSGGGYLWSLGYYDIVRYDGQNWQRIEFPGNPPVGISP